MLLRHFKHIFDNFRNAAAASNAMKKLAVSLADSTDLRAILGVLYIMTEVLRNCENEQIRESFKAELRERNAENLI